MRKQRGPKSEWYICSPDGVMTAAEEFSRNEESDLGVFYLYETSGTREDKEAPAHIKMMQQFEMVDYEPAADSGNFRWLPKGHLVKRLMEKHASDIVKSYGGMQVETPIMYDLEHPQLASYLERFPARQYHLASGDKRYFLRFAACFGQYMIVHDMGLNSRHLPLKIYEMTHYSFRREQSGELSGLRRLRGFTMPDMHTICANIEQAREEFYHQYLLCKTWMKDLELDHVMAIRVVVDFFQENRDFILKFVRDFGKPVLLELWDKKFFYFILKFEFNILDGQKKAAALSTVQVDVENAERFNIHYFDEVGRQQNPPLLHMSVSGSIDRNLYALLEKQAIRKEKGEVPVLPFWLCPTQLRLIPVSDNHISRCLEIVSQIKVRTEVDDRNETVGYKIRDAEVSWIPFIGVVGDRELEDNTITLRERGRSGKNTKGIVEISRLCGELQANKPFEALGWPCLISKQPRFR